MALAYINLSAKQYINFMCRTDFERSIFHNTYREFQKKAKPYVKNNSLHTFSQMLEENENAYSLHQKLEFSVTDALDSLKNKMPDLNDTRGQAILFDWAELQIHTSDLLNKAAHVVSITYTSPKLILHQTIGDFLVLSYHPKADFNKIFTVKLTDDLVVNDIKNLQMA